MSSGTRRAFLVSLCALVLATLTACKSSSKKEAAASNNRMKPINVVLITLDTVRADHLHCYGYDKIKTPNLDALAKHGVLFEKAVTQTPLTLPSHASMFTGQNPNVHGVRNNGGFVLPPSSVTLAMVLHNHGWDTAAFISASVLKKMFGLNQGFTTYDDHITSPINGDNIAVRPGNVTVDHAIHWLDNRKAPPGQPFFLWVHLFDAHQPYQPPEPFASEYRTHLYDGAIAYDDQLVGRLLAAVRKKSPADRTLIVVLSDHGQSLGDHGEYEHGIFLYDSTMRIAWIMAGPGVPAGVRVHQQTREIDLLPTILNVLGGKAPPGSQGTSLVPTFSGKPVDTTYSYEETLVPRINMGWSALFGVHTAHWMYVRAPRPELYNLDKDPGELDNVISQYPKEYRLLNAELNRLSMVDGHSTDMAVEEQPMDPVTMKQLESLGYVSGFSARRFTLNGQGDDPKDHLATLKTLEDISDIHDITGGREAAMLEHALQSDPGNPTLWGWLIDSYSRAGENARAIQAGEQALQRGVRGEQVYFKIANLYLKEGDVQKAIVYYRKNAEANPLDVAGQNNLATAYMQIGRLDDARRTFEWVLRVQPYAPAYNGLGILAMRRNNLAEARKDFDSALKLDPKDVEANLNLGILCAKSGDKPCARAAFKTFLANVPHGEYKDMVPKVKYALTHLLQPGT